MIDSVGATAASMEAVNRQYEAITHNLANSSTTAFKRTLCVQTSGDGGDAGPAGIAPTLSVDFTQGNFIQTDRPLDLALSGPGFFTLETPGGVLYTRNGTFQTNAEGQLVDAFGRVVAGENGPIVIPRSAASSSVNVAADGRVTAAGAPVGKLRIAEFKDLQALTPVGQGAYRTAAPPDPAAKTTVRQGYQEGSNVNVVEELVGLITAARAYEANLKVVQAGSERTKSLLQVALG